MTVALAAVMQLQQLFPAIERRLAALDVVDIASHSAEVVPGGLFLACAGTRDHGLRFLDQALARRPRAVAWEPADGFAAPRLPAGVAGISMPGLGRELGAIASRFFGEPSRELAVLGITGTNGKTTVAWLVAQALESLGAHSAYVGTLGSGLGTHLRADTLTTPGSINLQRRLREFADAGANHVALEVSSHALDQDRVAGVRFRVAACTNLSRDHLDYHGTLERYAAAKARLFLDCTPAHAVLNVGDAFPRELLARLPADLPRTTVLVAAAGDASATATLVLRPLRAESGSSRLSLESAGGRVEFATPLVGAFNLENLAVAAGILHALGQSLVDIGYALAGATAPPGRMQRLAAAHGPRVIVDFAHTPAALARALATLRADTAGRLWCVFGCGGERDRGKRPLMGEAAAAGADELVLTDDNPRGEDGDEIVAAIRRGMPAARAVTVLRDRQAAIEYAIATAAATDTVLIAGKGHEAVQVSADGSRPFSDQQVAGAALARRS
jgi:UDP-N-acetylmuramoyl-L-alanyl-D-glutamate--2,6-diaminopimelate ligase